MQVKFYTFSKRENSTKQPTASTASTFTCVLKDESGVLAPVIKVDPAIGNPRTFNYAYISDFGRYYYVREWTYYRGEWTASLEVDVLASWKSQIGASTLYILRSSKSSLWNKSIIDNKYPTLGPTKHIQVDTGNTGPWNSMSYVIGTTGDSTNSSVTTIGGVNYYCCDQPIATRVFQWLTGHGVNSYTGDLNTAFNNFADDLFLATYDPMQFITTVKFFPFSVATFPGAGSFVIGKVDYAITGMHTFSWPVQSFGPYTFSIPKHPLIATRGEYLSTSPYSDYVFELQPYGRIELDGSQLAKADTLSYEMKIDMVSGDSLLYLSATGPDSYYTDLGVYPGRVGTDIQIAQITSNVMQTAVTESFKAAGAAMTDNWFGVADAAISAATDSKFRGSVRGSEGSFIVSDLSNSFPRLHLYYKEVTDMYATTFGYPVCKSSKISSAASFMICATGDVAFAGTSEEHKSVANFLTSGFFYE